MPEWWDEYIAYDALKKAVYQLEKQQAGLSESFYSEHHDLEANEETALIGSPQGASTDSMFVPLLDRELKKICIFYDTQEKELEEEVEHLQHLVQQQEEVGPDAGHQYMDGDTEDDDDEEEEDDDDFDARGSPIVSSRDPTRSPSRPPTGRRHARSMSSAAATASRSRRRFDSNPTRRYSISSTEDHGDLEASIASLRSQYAQPSGPSQVAGSSHSPKVTTKTIAAKVKGMRDSIASLTTGPPTVWTAKNNYATDIQLLFKRRITNLYLTATSLRSYVELNYSGFRKILKKYDKVTDSSLQAHYLHDVVEQAPPFSQAAKDRLNATIATLVGLYTKCVTRGDHHVAQRQLRLHQREHIAWERDTVWRQMIGNARRGATEDSPAALGGTLVLEPEKGLLDVRTKAGHLRLTMKHVYLLVSLVVFTILLNVQTVDGVEASRCLAVLVFATIMWATEAIPLFVTSILIPLLLVVLRVIRSPDGEERLETPDATKCVYIQAYPPLHVLTLSTQVHILRHVLSNNHAPHWWFHYRVCSEQNRYRPCIDYESAQSRRDETQCCPTRFHGRCMFREYVDQ